MCWEWSMVFEPKGSGRGKGVKEKNRNNALNNEAVMDGVVPSDTVASGSIMICKMRIWDNLCLLVQLLVHRVRLLCRLQHY
ncbi:hypothetical protein Tco_1149589 [Tanacetum coccineum]